ncbi:MAG TPA: zf-HC2 domain-containing protein [Gaiellaceae bacterium]
MARRWASEELDEELGAANALRLRAHVLHCSSCRQFRRQLRSFTPTLRRERTASPLARVIGPMKPRLVAVAAAAVLVASLAAGTDLVGRQGESGTVGALPATEGLPVYGPSPSRVADMLR